MTTLERALIMNAIYDALDRNLNDLMQGVVDRCGTVPDAMKAKIIEQLRRLEDLARSNGDNRQIVQKIMSARRVLGDRADFGPVAAFAADNAIYSIRPTPKQTVARQSH